MELFTAIHCRRSRAVLTAPGPSAEDVETLLAAAVAAPDHGRRTPWRFVILAGEGKDAFADVVEKAFRARTAGPVDPARLARETARLARAPMVIAIACVAGDGDSIPHRERLAATAAATQNLLLAATALGYGSIWRTGWLADDPHVKRELGLSPADDIVAFVHLGGADGDQRMRPRPAAEPGEVSWAWPLSR
ncbi:nitroreductase family protein [Actinomadura roseirufa]|uniref:nitroreductase family protein n=1 Tax=Actinomadura roseirufa TaxID=2094049 RepID=UPI00104176BC|nr:nitroreductase [Actinomadura roseirufa]